MKLTPIHILWGEEAVRRYRLGMIDNIVRLAHAHYDFEHAVEARGFLAGVTAARQPETWAHVTSLPDLNKLGPPLRSKLLQAIREGNVLLVAELVDIGVSLTATDSHGLTPLHWAAREGEVKIAEILLEHGAPLDATAEGAHDSTPLLLACESPKPGAKDVAVLLIDRGANVDAQNSNGDTAMHHVSRVAEAAVLKALVAAQANPEIANSRGLTPLELVALQHGHATSENADIHHLLETARLAAAQRQRTLGASMRKPKLRPTPYDR